MAVTRYRLPWGQFIGSDCACAPDAPCLMHFDGLDWRGRSQALTRGPAVHREVAMPDNDLRPEVVAALSEPQQLSAELVDQVLDATDAEREAAAGVLLEQTRAFLEQTGVLRPSVGIMDLSYRTAAAICATLGTVQGVWSQPAFQDRPLGDVLKVVDPAQADWVMGVLRWGGLLPPE